MKCEIDPNHPLRLERLDKSADFLTERFANEENQLKGNIE
jgi:hypothetical protein